MGGIINGIYYIKRKDGTLFPVKNKEEYDKWGDWFLKTRN